MSTAVGPGPLESIGHLARGGQGKAFAGEGWPGAVSAQALEGSAVVPADLDRRVEREAVERDRAAVDQERWGGGPCRRQERLDGTGLGGSEDSRFVIERCVEVTLVGRHDGEDLPGDLHRDGEDILVAWAGQRVEGHPAIVSVFDEDPIRGHGVKMNGQVELATEALERM